MAKGSNLSDILQESAKSLRKLANNSKETAKFIKSESEEAQKLAKNASDIQTTIDTISNKED